MSKWINNPEISSEKLLKWHASVVECKCPNCNRWCLRWSDVQEYEFCPSCSASMVEEISSEEKCWSTGEYTDDCICETCNHAYECSGSNIKEDDDDE